MPSLLDMTDVPMTNILEQCDFKSVLTLRKVCRDLRNFIDEANLKTKLSILRITINSDDFSFRSYINGPAGAAEHCTSEDLKIILRIQNSKLSNFAVVNQSGNPENLDALEEILERKPRPLQTESLDLKVFSGSEVLKILPHLDAKVLKHITLMTPVGVREIRNLDEIERILELDQFKMASELTINGFSMNASLKNFFHFEKVQVKFNGVRFEDVVALKEAFTTSTYMRWFSLGEYEMKKKRFERVFGVPLEYIWRSEAKVITYPMKKWYFKIRTSEDHVLVMNFCLKTRRLSFRRVEIADVVENAIVRD